MKTSKQIRAKKLEQLIQEYGTIEAVAAAAGTAAQYLSQIKNGVASASGNPRGIGDALARKLERGCNKHEGWMDQIESNDAESLEKASQPALTLHVTDKSKVGLIYVDLEELLLITSFREATDDGRDSIRAAALAATKKSLMGGIRRDQH